MSAIAIAACVAVWFVGWVLTRPATFAIGAPPSDFPAQAVRLYDAAGQRIDGWYVPGMPNRGAVLLLHGVRANRLSMLDRARFLHTAGYAVLLIDFQASGESPGSTITFGYREADDVKASLRYLRQRLPGDRIGIIGTSMGGAATILSAPNLDADAVVLEQVYPTIRQALQDRLTIYLGVPGRWLAPVMLSTLHVHLGIAPDQLQPINHIGQLSMPKLLIVGDQDRHTTIAESYAMYNAAHLPKELWVIHGAQHVDLYRYEGAAYRERILNFFAASLRNEQHAAERISTVR